MKAKNIKLTIDENKLFSELTFDVVENDQVILHHGIGNAAARLPANASTNDLDYLIEEELRRVKRDNALREELKNELRRIKQISISPEVGITPVPTKPGLPATIEVAEDEASVIRGLAVSPANQVEIIGDLGNMLIPVVDNAFEIPVPPLVANEYNSIARALNQFGDHSEELQFKVVVKKEVTL